MKIRGERECTECDTRWSYYETGSVGCPACGSLRSVGMDDRSEHTDVRAEFDLTSIRADVDDVTTAELADRARDHCREYVRQRGFLSGGTLLELDETYLAALELLHVADVLTRSRHLDTRDELYFLTVLAGADAGDRPAPEEVPSSLQDARGLAYANAVRAYRRDVRRWSDDRTLGATERSCLETLGDHVRRIRLLEGDVDPETAESLIDATRALADGLRGDEAALDQAREMLTELTP